MVKSKTNKSARRSKKRNQEKKEFTPEPEPKKVKHFKEETNTTATIATNQPNVTTQLKEQTPDTSQESSECKSTSTPSTVPTSLATKELKKKIENKDQPSNKDDVLKNGREELKEKQVGNKCPHGIVKDKFCVECDIELIKEVNKKIMSFPKPSIKIQLARLDMLNAMIRAHPEDYDELCEDFFKDKYKELEVLDDCINRLEASDARMKKLIPDLEAPKKI